jgi:hypothetical protein
MLMKYMPDVFGIEMLAERLGEGNANRFHALPNWGVINRVKDMEADPVFVVSFTGQMGVEVWILPVADTGTTSEIAQEERASLFFRKEIAPRNGQELVRVFDGMSYTWTEQDVPVIPLAE